jgi:selenocysteine lyase/cysteine desulfurase
MRALGADFIAMPGHKGLLGPQGTGILLCKNQAQPLLYGGTGSESVRQDMPDFLPDRLEAGTLNVPGIAGLDAGMRYVNRLGLSTIFRREHRQLELCAGELRKMGHQPLCGEHQAATLSFVPTGDCEVLAEKLGKAGVAVRAGLHCAPLAHESVGTLQTGTVRLSFGHAADTVKTREFLRILSRLS